MFKDAGADMRKAEKKEVLDFINSFNQAHEEIKAALTQKKILSAQHMLSECQAFAIQLGETIEKLAGEGHVTVTYVEEYCDILFYVYEQINEKNINANRIGKLLTKFLVKIQNSVKQDIAVRKEIVFFPYKASMWDSLESIYFAAKADSGCDVYCVPIPYFDLLPDHTLGEMHYEGYEYPDGIEVIDWQAYRFEERRPDVIYIHNPYDHWNLVTSVHPRFYSEKLKKYTETLVYVPYYSTTGGMSEAQKLCPAYIYADYIVTQAPGFREYFDERIPDKKFLPLGSPKFDNIIRKCKNPSAPPSDWKLKMEGKKVYFYNTSINGMLGNTKDFLQKMKYVFSCFEGRMDVCLLWRPHPLLESTFDSMRPAYKQEYLSLKQDFLDKAIGIYDTTTDMENTIALCDAYIGDAASSVVSLFGIVGKPIFILNNKLHSEPTKDSWRGEIQATFHYMQKDRFSITQGNRLYVSEPFEHNYKFLCDISDYVYSGEYNVVYEIDSKFYICPQNAQNILVIDKTGKRKKIDLEREDIQTDAFIWTDSWWEKYLLLLPHRYPAMVKYDVITGKIKYIKEGIDIFVKEENGIIKSGGCGDKNGKLYLSSPTNNQIYIFDVETEEYTIAEIPVKVNCGYNYIMGYGEDLWLLPCEGEEMKIIRWNPDTNAAEEFGQFPEGFQCIDPISGVECAERPFLNGAFWGNNLYLAPDRGNMYVRLDIVTGKMTEWKPPFEEEEGKEYFYTSAKSTFLWEMADENGKVRIFSAPDRRLYEVDLAADQCKELKVEFNVTELKAHEPGFCCSSKWLRYCCHENAFNSLRDFLDGAITGNSFDRDMQIKKYGEIAANNDGTCGAKVHEFVRRL